MFKKELLEFFMMIIVAPILNTEILMKGICKFENNLSSPLVDYVFQVENTFNLRHFQKIANNKKTQ